ncbi:integrin beta-1-like isoform X2 [Simochromis diagramma]|uniref:integrin beta-1-like isoform X2 n=1 Tax=Simochromis diagramma TaxID=43689 RepID=UPI001A7E82E0|nr:integrin beta-1-like isoform X2 [Simochromis diagramma]
MAVKLSHLFLLLVMPSLSLTSGQKCSTSDSSCNQCIQSGPECAWCTAPNSNIHCHTVKGLQRAGCHKGHIYIYKPQSSVQVIRNDSRTDIADAKTIFLQPQELAIHLRPGVSQSFPLSISMPSDHPTTDLTLDTSNVPAGLNITFSSITTGNPLLMQVTVEAAQCPSKSDISNQNSTAPWSVQITPRGFAKSVTLEVTLQCQCSCTENREENSPTCSSHGALVCGRCVCHQPYVGNLCQTDITSFESENEDSCRSRPGAPVCSGRGVCVSGMCHCNQRENPEKIRGQFCECTNFDCPYHENRICGGNGICECGMCRCYANWTGRDCSCSTETASCVAKNQQLCNGRGNCVCGKCQCLPQYQGPTCVTESVATSS